MLLVLEQFSQAPGQTVRSSITSLQAIKLTRPQTNLKGLNTTNISRLGCRPTPSTPNHPNRAIAGLCYTDHMRCRNAKYSRYVCIEIYICTHIYYTYKLVFIHANIYIYTYIYIYYVYIYIYTHYSTASSYKQFTDIVLYFAFTLGNC